MDFCTAFPDSGDFLLQWEKDFQKIVKFLHGEQRIKDKKVKCLLEKLTENLQESKCLLRLVVEIISKRSHKFLLKGN